MLKKFLKNWRMVAVTLLVVSGGFLIYPAFRILPVLVNIASARAYHHDNSSRDFQSVKLTPVQPIKFNRTFLPIVNHSGNRQDNSISNTNHLPVIGEIDFSPGTKQIVISILPEDRYFNSGKPVDIAFLPDEQCNYGDGKACIYFFPTSNSRRVIFVSVHSGVGGEGEEFRNALEGTGINQGLLTADRVETNIRAFFGAGISLFQGEKESLGHELIAVVRIPPEHLQVYLALPVEKALDFALELNALQPVIYQHNLLVLETCGWWLPGDRQAPGVSGTTGSVYLGLVRIDE